jgi:hypothetical protein
MDQIEAMNKTCTEAASTEHDHADKDGMMITTTKPTCTDRSNKIGLHRQLQGLWESKIFGSG